MVCHLSFTSHILLVSFWPPLIPMHDLLEGKEEEKEKRCRVLCLLGILSHLLEIHLLFQVLFILVKVVWREVRERASSLHPKLFDLLILTLQIHNHLKWKGEHILCWRKVSFHMLCVTCPLNISVWSSNGPKSTRILNWIAEKAKVWQNGKQTEQNRNKELQTERLSGTLGSRSALPKLTDKRNWRVVKEYDRKK